MSWRIAIFAVVVWLMLGVIWLAMGLRIASVKTVIDAQGVLIDIDKGDSLTGITQKLVARRLPIQPFWFKTAAYRFNLAGKLKVGEYELRPGMTTVGLLQLFASGKTRQHAITFPEGWTFRQILQAVQENPVLQHTLATTDYAKILAKLGADRLHPEGLFFPDTYFFEKNSSDLALLQRAYDKMHSVLADEWQAREQGLPLSDAYQALILASIVEKETAVAEERQRVAGVFVRRLQQGMLLQTDPTVIYGMGDAYQGDIRSHDLKQPTPYNTYVNPGLPPTPIAMPGLSAIRAALHPDTGRALYFVAIGDGGHVFSETLAEHRQWVEKYQVKK